MILHDPIETVKGVGTQTAEKFHRLGVRTVADLLELLPRRYEDFAAIGQIKDVRPGQVTIRARVESITTKRVRRGLSITDAVLFDASGKLRAVWFNQPYRVAQLDGKDEFVFTGVYDFQRNRYVLQNPSAEKASELIERVETGKIIPIYPETKGLKSHAIRQVVDQVLPLVDALPESLPADVVEREKLLSRAETLRALHAPRDHESLERARERFAFEELFELLMASLLNKQDNGTLPSWQMPFDETAAKQFVAALPFRLTNAQKVAAWEIIKNFEAGQPMNRLLQGDVGSGKTVVAAMSAFLAARSGFQTALMAPTEILATQHARTLAELLEPFGLHVALLVGSVKGQRRQHIYDGLKNGSIDVVVGTHALIQDTVNFQQLGFVIIDEQHRFGVRQRAELLTKSERMPHLLAMSATPIPRSLALTVYGELDISVLDERPKGRKPIKTTIVSPNSRDAMYAAVDKEIAAGRQVYVVCPLIDDGVDAESRSVTSEYRRLQASVFKHRRIGLLHGQLRADEKERVMSLFAAGELDLLISTTVVEVGVDVPNATVMIIEGADRFGLAQLHQLRGRVGRSDQQSYCYLVPSTSDRPSARLREMEKSGDGFYLAERDLELRGPGEIYGRAQHGVLNLQIASLADTRLIRRARAAAEWCIENQLDMVQYDQLWSRIERYRRLTSLQ